MVFNSWEFMVFLAVVLAVYYALASHRVQNVFLIIASYFFYAFWDYRFLLLIVISTCVDYLVALKIRKTDNPRRRKQLLFASLAVNLGFLGIFKFFNFFIGTFSNIVHFFGFGELSHTLNIILPVGISFYTFQTMAYTIDVYRGKQKATNDFIAFALYVCYFPQLVAGPIERAQNLLPIMQSKRRVTQEQVFAGIQLVLIGLVKKVAIADAVAPYVNEIFAAPKAFTSPELLLGACLFSLQVYGDFSGYSDIARGVSKLLGIELMINFTQPYLSQTIREFWQRWHISLSSWLRDYLYIPLGGNRKGEWKTYRNLFITMFLGGLWHGAAWTFVVWGCLHGIYLAISRYRFGSSQQVVHTPKQSFLHRVVRTILTFLLVTFTWIFFRAPDFVVATDYIRGIVNPANFGLSSELPSLLLVTIFYVLIVLALDIPLYRHNQELLVTDKIHWVQRATIYAGLILMLSFLGENSVQPFIYFQF